MDSQVTMAELRARNEAAVQRMVTAVASFSSKQMLEPLLADGRCVKDVLAHLAWWDRWLVFILPAVPAMPHKAVAPPFMDQIPPGTAWADEMNARVFAYNQNRALADILSEFNAGYQNLVQRAALLTYDDLYDPDGMSATIGTQVAPLILGIYEHYEEHAAELEQILG